MKKIIKRILTLTIVFLMVISTPFYISENINNSPYVYAVATFEQTLESELFKKTLIPTLISAGLVFKTKESIEKAAEDTIEWLKQQGFDWRDPEEPEGPNLEEVIKEMLKAVTLVSASHELVKGIVKIPKMFWNLIKSFVDDNYNEGENIIGNEFETQGYINGYAYELDFRGIGTDLIEVYIKVNDGNFERLNLTDISPPWQLYYVTMKVTDIVSESSNKVKVYFDLRIYCHNPEDPTRDYYHPMRSKRVVVTVGPTTYPENPYPEYEPIIVIGTEGIVDNPDFDWNNEYTNSKDIVISIERDVYGDLKIDENGYYIPSIDIEEWVDVQPEEIPNLDPSGTPIPEIPEMPEVENPDDDEKTGIMIYIGNVLQTIVGQLSKLVDGVKTLVKNTNKLVFNTTSPELDPITGEPVAEGGGIIGNGIDTRIPTDFEWGSFRHFLDIFFIFIYFIVILILIILKFLQIVFVGLPAIQANAGLLAEYPGILEGVNYVKNLKVGGLAITVHQAFEFVFMIFFYIFIIKQIRKLYNAHVYEESSENTRVVQDVKKD